MLGRLFSSFPSRRKIASLGCSKTSHRFLHERNVVEFY